MSTTAPVSTTPSSSGPPPAKINGKDSSPSPATQSLVVRAIALESLKPSPLNPRKTQNAEADRELAESVAKNGVLQPILVRAVGKDGGLYEVVAGSRRFNAAKVAKLETIPARIMQLTDEQALEMAIIENLQREDVSAIEEGRGYRDLIEMRFKANPKVGRQALVDAVAKDVGKSVRYVYTRMKLAELVPDVQKALEAGKISASHADLMVTFGAEQQKQALKYITRFRDEGPVGIREFKRWIESELQHDLSAAPWKKDDAQLIPAAGACVNCPKRTGAHPAVNDEPKKDLCLDPVCHSAKRQAFVKLQEIQLVGRHIAAVNPEGGAAKAKELAAKTKVVRISPLESYQSDLEGNDEKGVLFGSHGREYVILKKPDECRYAQPAVLVEGPETGHGRTVCTNQSCDIHWQKRGSSTSPRGYQDPYRKKQLAQEKARRLEMQVRIEALKQAIKSQHSGHKDLDLKEIALDYFKAIGHDRQNQLCKALEWEPGKTSYGPPSYEAAAKREVPKLSGPQIMTLLRACAASDDCCISSYYSTLPKLGYLEQFCKSTRVKIGDLRAVAKAAAEAKKKKKPKAAQTSAGKKAKAKGGRK